jgi:hypothetical protein
MIIVDRVEGKLAVCESDGRMMDVPIKLIRGKVRDGVVIVEGGGFYLVDEEATKKRENEVKDKSKGVWDAE